MRSRAAATLSKTTTVPIAREIGPRLTRIDKALGELTDQMHRLSSLEDERSLLKRLIVLSSEIEGLTAGVSYRFSAARAYYALVGERIADLRETRAEGFQTVREFMERRLAPGMRTCESVVARQQALTDRANRAANLLRTRVDIELEGQNRDLLASMNRRAHLQLRLQQTVEGLSVAAITYYLVSLAGYAFKAVDAAGIPVDVDIGRALSIPVIAALVWMGVRRLRRSLDAAEKAD